MAGSQKKCMEYFGDIEFRMWGIFQVGGEKSGKKNLNRLNVFDVSLRRQSDFVSVEESLNI